MKLYMKLASAAGMSSMLAACAMDGDERYPNTGMAMTGSAHAAMPMGAAQTDVRSDQQVGQSVGQHAVRDEPVPEALRAADSAFERIIASWPERPKLGARQMMVKYGMPQEATAEKVVWHNAGPYKRIMVTKMEIPHDFPLPHMDFMEHTIAYNVPADKTDELIAFDGSSTINRTARDYYAKAMKAFKASGEMDPYMTELKFATNAMQGDTDKAAG